MKQGVASARRLVTARPWLSVVVVLAVVAGAVFGYRRWGTGSHSTTAAATVTSRLVTVSTGTVKESVSTTGTLTPADEEDLSFSSSAVITSVRVTQGEKVTKGQVLGTIDTLALKATLAQARAQLATAQATVAAAEDAGDTTDAQLAADKASVSTATAAVTSAKAALAAAVLRAPIAGTVAEVNVAKGDTAAGSGGSSSSSTGSSDTRASGSSGSGGSGGSGSSGSGSGSGSGGSGGSSSGGGATTATSTSSSADFVVIGMKKWSVSASVDDTEVGNVAKGDQVQMTTDNVTGLVFGTVSSVSVLSSSSSGSASYPVEIAVTGAPAGLHDGASVTASIIYKQVTNVLTVPTTAVHSDGSTSYVYVSRNGARTKTTVTTGLSSGGTTQITKGLTANQQVYVETTTGGNRGTGSRSGTTGGTTRNGYTGGGFGRGNFPAGGGNFGGGNFGGGNFPAGGGNAGGGGNP